MLPSLILIGVAAFYWQLLTNTNTSIYGDTADVSYPVQKYIADRAMGHTLPFWTPYIYSGYPLLANPLSGAWYPLNWPFLLTRVTPWTMKLELALNAFLACLGMFFFLERQVERRSAALIGALAYGLSGFFTANTGRLGVFCAAACFPWVLLAYRRAVDGPGKRYIGLGGLAAAAMMLAGYPFIALLGVCGLFLYALSDVFFAGVKAKRALGIAAAISVGALLVASVQTLPGWELSTHSIDAPVAQYRQGVMEPKHLLTLAWANAMGTLSGKDRNRPADHYLYAGLLLLPLAAAGFVKARRLRWAALLLLVPALWFAAGPMGGLYSGLALLPGFASMGPPVLAWFVAAFALAMAAAGGADWLFGRGGKWRIAAMVVPVLLFGDLLYCNSLGNPLAYLPTSYNRFYGIREALAYRFVAEPQLPLNRFDSATVVSGAGPLLHPLDTKFETTYGYFADEPRTYHDYHAMAEKNRKLLDGLNVSRFIDAQKKTIDVNGNVLPRAYFPAAVRDVNSEEQSRDALKALDPAVASTVMTPHAPIEQDAKATVMIVTYDEQSYRMHYHAESPSLLKLSMAWYPGWTATMGGRSLPVVRVDHALMGVVVPAGDHEIEFRFHSRYFEAGAVISAAAALILMWMAFGDKLMAYLDRVLLDPMRSKRKRRTHRRETKAGAYNV